MIHYSSVLYGGLRSIAPEEVLYLQYLLNPLCTVEYPSVQSIDMN